jgi:hypothetical protein
MIAPLDQKPQIRRQLRTHPPDAYRRFSNRENNILNLRCEFVYLSQDESRVGRAMRRPTMNFSLYGRIGASLDPPSIF